MVMVGCDRGCLMGEVIMITKRGCGMLDTRSVVHTVDRMENQLRAPPYLSCLEGKDEYADWKYPTFGR